MKVTEKDVTTVADLANLELTPAEREPGAYQSVRCWARDAPSFPHFW